MDIINARQTEAGVVNKVISTTHGCETNRGDDWEEGGGAVLA